MKSMEIEMKEGKKREGKSHRMWTDVPVFKFTIFLSFLNLVTLLFQLLARNTTIRFYEKEKENRPDRRDEDEKLLFKGRI